MASAPTTMALARCASRLPCKNHVGVLGVAHVQSTQYSTGKNVNVAAWKRGTGGRSSFNGLVATVFGATGFVGTYLVNQLGKIGTQVIIPYRCDFYDCQKLKVAGDLGQILFQEFHLRDQESIEKAIKYSNVVINLIGRNYETKNFTYNDVHVEGARNIARACKKMGVERLIHLSYLNSAEDPEPLAMKTQSQFKISKWHGERAIMEEFPDATIIKASDIYGSEDRFLYGLVNDLRRDGTWISLWKKGEATEKQPVFVSDVARGITKCALDSDTRGQLYQAVGPKRYLMSELVDWLFNVMRRDKKWGYQRFDMKYNPFFQMRVTLTEKLSPSWPIGLLHWEGIEREATSDTILKGVPTLEDLGVTLTEMENEVPWIMRQYRAYNYYMETLGEFETPAPPKTVPLQM